MRQFQKILVPVDFSGPSRAALALALQLADRLGGGVSLLHAYLLPMYAFADGAAIGPQVAEELAADARKALDRLAEEAGARDAPRKVVPVAGSPVETILREARELGADLIVMGTHGRTGLSHVLAGSVAERVVRLAACPVVTVRE